MVFEKEEGNLSVSTENLLPIIKKWLYSEHDIFLRELISNAHDAIMKLKQLKLSGEFQEEEPEYEIVIIPDKNAGTLTIRDNGIGMTAEEVKKYINQIAFSGAREFVQKYQNVKDQNSLIGHFGLGFYSAFMVAKEVRILTRSYRKDAQAVLWQSDGSIRYSLSMAEKEKHGTDIILFLNEESKEYLEHNKIKQLVRKYSHFLPVPIFLLENNQKEKLNKGEPIWKKNPNDLKDNDYIEFYKELFPSEFEPLFWIHIKTDYPFELSGVLYFPKLLHELDASKGNIKLFVNNVFVADNIKEITPDFLSVLMGALDSPDIPLNVSRSQLQGDPRIKKIASHIVKKVAEKLTYLFEKDKEKYKTIWAEIQTFLKFGCIQDHQFYENLKNAILFKNFDNQYISLEEYIERNREKNKTNDQKTLILYLNEERENSAFDVFLKELGLEALLVNSTIDSHFIDFIERQRNDVRFARADADINETFFDSVSVLDSTKEKQIIELFKNYLEKPSLEITVKNFKTEKVPALLASPENVRRLQEMTTMMIGKKTLGGFIKEILIINAKSPAVQKLLLLDTTDKEKARNLVYHIFAIAALMTGKLKGEDLSFFVQKSIENINV